MAINVVENKRQIKWQNQTIIVWKESLLVCICHYLSAFFSHHLFSIYIYRLVSLLIRYIIYIYILYIYIKEIYIYIWCKYRWGPFLPHITVGICTRLGMLTVDVVLSAQLLLHQPVFHHSLWEHPTKEKKNAMVCVKETLPYSSHG